VNKGALLENVFEPSAYLLAMVIGGWFIRAWLMGLANRMGGLFKFSVGNTKMLLQSRNLAFFVQNLMNCLVSIKWVCRGVIGHESLLRLQKNDDSL